MQRLLERTEPMFLPYLSGFFPRENLLPVRVQSTALVVLWRIVFSHVQKVSWPQIVHFYGFQRKPILGPLGQYYR